MTTSSNEHAYLSQKNTELLAALQTWGVHATFEFPGFIAVPLDHMKGEDDDRFLTIDATSGPVEEGWVINIDSSEGLADHTVDHKFLSFDLPVSDVACYISDLMHQETGYKFVESRWHAQAIMNRHASYESLVAKGFHTVDLAGGCCAWFGRVGEYLVLINDCDAYADFACAVINEDVREWNDGDRVSACVYATHSPLRDHESEDAGEMEEKIHEVMTDSEFEFEYTFEHLWTDEIVGKVVECLNSMENESKVEINGVEDNISQRARALIYKAIDDVRTGEFEWSGEGDYTEEKAIEESIENQLFEAEDDILADESRGDDFARARFDLLKREVERHTSGEFLPVEKTRKSPLDVFMESKHFVSSTADCWERILVDMGMTEENGVLDMEVLDGFGEVGRPTGIWFFGCEAKRHADGGPLVGNYVWQFGSGDDITYEAEVVGDWFDSDELRDVAKELFDFLVGEGIYSPTGRLNSEPKWLGAPAVEETKTPAKIQPCECAYWEGEDMEEDPSKATPQAIYDAASGRLCCIECGRDLYLARD